MNGKENPVELLVMCAVMIVLSVLGILGGFSRDLFGNMDGILILGICLMMLLVALLLLFGLAKEQGWIGKHQDADGSSATPAKAK
jgi:uncharacterized RDD family membrane protein YckC